MLSHKQLLQLRPLHTPQWVLLLPMEVTTCALQPAEGSALAPSSATSKINHISLKEQNELELCLNPLGREGGAGALPGLAGDSRQ